ncbi:hypothetical protein MRB53_041762 [Persea americana]|nr:hypothetical protein MRB53_041762 [Persea americana]
MSSTGSFKYLTSRIQPRELYRHVAALVIFNFAFFAYSAVQIKEIHNVMFVPCVVGIAQVVYFVSSAQLYKIFGWDIYTKLGADRRVKNYFLAYQLLIVLLCYDWFFFGGFTVQLLILYVDNSNWEFWVTVGALPVTVFGLLAGRFAVRRELRSLIYIFDLCLFAAMAYFCYQLYRIYGSHHADKYQNDRITLTIFAGVSIILLIFTFLITMICHSYFGKADLWSKRRHVEDPDDVSIQFGEIDNSYAYSKRVLLD